MKHVLVGEFDSFGTFYAADGDEWDWEIRIVPDPPFRFILERIVAVCQPATGTGAWLRRNGPRVVRRVEGDADEDFRSGFPNRWGPRPGRRWQSTARGRGTSVTAGVPRSAPARWSGG